MKYCGKNLEKYMKKSGDKDFGMTAGDVGTDDFETPDTKKLDSEWDKGEGPKTKKASKGLKKYEKLMKG